MTAIRESFGQIAVECNNYNDTVSKLDLITSNVQIVRKFFSPDDYADSGDLPIAVEYQENSLNKLFSQFRDLDIIMNYIIFKASWFNNGLPFTGERIETYYKDADHFSVGSIND